LFVWLGISVSGCLLGFAAYSASKDGVTVYLNPATEGRR